MRHRNQQRTRRSGSRKASILAGAIAALLCSAAAAQDAPQQLPAAPDSLDSAPATAAAAADAAEQPQQLPAAPQAQASFVLRDVVFKGVTMFDPAELRGLVADSIGRTVAFADLQALTQRVTSHYHRHGYILSQAVLPVQEVRDGVVEISVIEGRLNSVKVEFDPATPIARERIERMVQPLSTGGALDGPRYERTMLLMADLPGVRPQSTLETGRQIGSSDLVVEVAPTDRRVRYSVELDNHGTEEAGRYRLGATMRVASPFRIGDNLDLRLLASDEKILEGEGTLFGRASYEMPLGHNGTRLGVGVSRVSYSLGGEFEILDATGVARIYDVGVTHPLLRQRGQNLYLRGYVDRKDLTDELRAVDFSADKRAQGVGLSWSWERRDNLGGGGYWSSGGALYFGELDLLNAAIREVDAGPFGRNTEGSFRKLTTQFARLQRLTDRLSLRAAVGVQLTDGNLDASEKLSLGGPRAVRAYPSSEVLVDEGAIANLELRWAMNQAFSGFVFHDIATGDINHEPGPFDLDNSRTIRGSGLGLSYGARSGLSGVLTVAWRGSEPAVTDGGDRDPRVFFHLMKSF